MPPESSLDHQHQSTEWASTHEIDGGPQPAEPSAQPPHPTREELWKKIEKSIEPSSCSLGVLPPADLPPEVKYKVWQICASEDRSVPLPVDVICRNPSHPVVWVNTLLAVILIAMSTANWGVDWWNISKAQIALSLGLLSLDYYLCR